MDECLSPGIFWPYGNPRLRVQLTYLTWNAYCKANLINSLKDELSADKMREAVKQIAYAESLLDKQSDELFRIAAES